MFKEPILGLEGMANIGLLKNGGKAQYYYWIEFLHHRKMGQKIWLKRKREEVLLSVRYSREQQRSYE